jgi:succinate dehydrogenase / fumarate reductase membrane anchor subunit
MAGSRGGGRFDCLLLDYLMSSRSPLSRVLGSGSAKEGTDHWWMQRVTAIALLILGAWFLISLAALDTYSESDMYAWVASPFNAIMLLLASITLVWHSMLGIQIIIEDYVHGPGLKVVSIILSKFVHVFMGVAAVLAILKVVLGGSA